MPIMTIIPFGIHLVPSHEKFCWVLSMMFWCLHRAKINISGGKMKSNRVLVYKQFKII